MKMHIHKFAFESHKIIDSLTDAEKSDFFDKTEQLSFKKGKLLFYEGGIPSGVFLLKRGKTKIFKTGIDGKDQIFYIYSEGDLMGYHALLCQEPYEDSCETLEPCEFLFIGKQAFTELLQTIPHLKDTLIQNMSHEFGVMVNIIAVLAQKPVRERLALFLLILQAKYTKQTLEDARITLPREDLANIIGTARENLGRLLKEFREDGLVFIDKKAILIRDASRLQHLADANYAYR